MRCWFGYLIMRSRSQKVLAVAFLATALCADRAITAAPIFQSETTTGTLAGRLVSRLSVNLRRTIPAARVYQTRREGIAHQTATVTPTPVVFLPVRLSPFQFRLPPPSL
jgi:hypothetical protein